MKDKYTSFELMEMFNIKKGSWNNLKKKFDLDSYAEKIVEGNRIKYSYSKDAYQILLDNLNIESKENVSGNNSCNDSDIVIYQNQMIDIYKQRIEYLENENKRLLDIISLKEQKEIASSINQIKGNENIGLLGKITSFFHKDNKQE